MLFFLASAHCLETEPCRGSLNSLCGAPSPSGPPRPPAPPHHFLSRAVPRTPWSRLSVFSLSSVTSHCVPCILKPPPQFTDGTGSLRPLSFRVSGPAASSGIRSWLLPKTEVLCASVLKLVSFRAPRGLHLGCPIPAAFTLKPALLLAVRREIFP